MPVELYAKVICLNEEVKKLQPVIGGDFVGTECQQDRFIIDLGWITPGRLDFIAERIVDCRMEAKIEVLATNNSQILPFTTHFKKVGDSIQRNEISVTDQAKIDVLDAIRDLKNKNLTVDEVLAHFADILDKEAYIPAF